MKANPGLRSAGSGVCAGDWVLGCEQLNFPLGGVRAYLVGHVAFAPVVSPGGLFSSIAGLLSRALRVSKSSGFGGEETDAARLRARAVPSPTPILSFKASPRPSRMEEGGAHTRRGHRQCGSWGTVETGL